MAHLQTFKEMVVSDARSYSVETFEKAVNILARGSVGVDIETQNAFQALTAELASMHQNKKDQEVSLIFFIF